jgi:hypothetical protein
MNEGEIEKNQIQNYLKKKNNNQKIKNQIWQVKKLKNDEVGKKVQFSKLITIKQIGTNAIEKKDLEG